MKPRYILAAAVAATSVLALAAAPEPLPAVWHVTGKAPEKFTAGVDRSESAKGAKFLRSNTDDPAAWAALAQQVSARNYLGQRIRFRARVRTEAVSGWAGLWMRVDAESKPNAAFYNSADKPIKGSTGWQERSVVLDVPPDARTITFGVIDSGKGQVWIDALAFETVGREVPVDGMPAPRDLPATPTL
jgi:hypothetical protein